VTKDDDVANDDGRDWRTIDIVNDGVLWLVNRTVFHPRGYALAFDPESGEFGIYGDGSEPWRFEIDDDVEQTRFDAVRRLMGGPVHDTGPELRENAPDD
jgi:hypothetical protein